MTRRLRRLQGRALLGVLAGAGLGAPPAAAQGWRLRLDTRAQMAAYRGAELDSIAAGDAVTGPTGGPTTPDGFIVRCPVAGSQCYFFRPGIFRQGGPLTTTVDLTTWGLGVPGLSVRVNGRYGFDLGNTDVWPGTDPHLQLIEGYADYAARHASFRLGRQLLTNRLGVAGFDGARATAEAEHLHLDGELYLGLGLGQAVALPLTSPALNPLDEFRPDRRQLIGGGAVDWRGTRADARLDYQREVDRSTDEFVSERVALSAEARPALRWTVTAGTEYDLSNSWFGTSDLTVRYSTAKLGGTLGARQYRPHFDLWTIWGAFSPVPYHAVDATAWVVPVSRLQLRASAEWFAYSNTETATPLADVDDDGTRFGLGATFTPTARWTLDAGVHGDYGPGALADGFDASATFRPTPSLTLSGYGAILERPLEFRFGTTSIGVLGAAVDWQVTPQLRIGIGGEHYGEDRDRPDAASLDWTQTRLHAQITLLLNSGADRLPLPPAIRRRPAAGTRP